MAIRQGRSDVCVATSDRSGRFVVQGLRGGVWQLVVGQQGALVRLWTAEAAPPQARPLALIVVSKPVIRGQMPLQDFFASDAFVVAGLVAATIAIPIIAHNTSQGQPQSP